MKRRLVIGGGAAALVAAGVAVKGKSLFAKHYPPTPYDDVLTHLVDRDAAARLGPAALSALPGFTPAQGAAQLRARLGAHGLTAAAQADADAGRIVEARGWLLPESVALISALAAKA